MLSQLGVVAPFRVEPNGLH
ncbi:hypothetical protein MIMGU_mgv1a0151802mg, partial [Erythranthe guttata]